MSATKRYPDEVLKNLKFFEDSRVWHIVSRNPPVHSCADAAHRRSRLGHVGIPLSDELKSNLCAYDSAEGRRYVLLHCRGHQRIDERKVAVALGGEFARIEKAELEAVFGTSYGLVTPFLFAANSEVRQLVDETVLKPFFSPYTMMTNLGHFEYAVEFRPRELFRAFRNASIVDIVVDDDKRVPVGQTLGILTGNSPESGMLLWENINDIIRTNTLVRFRGDTGFPRVIVDSVPGMGLSMELPQREPDVRPIVIDAVRGLCENGANLIGIACNTTQYFGAEIEKICASYGARFVSMVDETAKFLRRQGIRRFDFLAIGAVSDLSEWSDFRRVMEEFEVNIPNLRDVADITDLAFSVKKEVVSSATINRLRDLINKATKTDTVLLALTELSIVFSSQKRRQRSGKIFIDTLDILAESMAKVYLDERFSTGGG